MAIVQNSIIGRAKNSVGGVVFTTWKSLNVIKSKPIKVRQNVTPAVQLNRDKISVVSKAVSKIGPFAKYIYNLGTTGTTAFAELQKFFRNRITYELFIDANLFVNVVVGSGNCVIGDFYTNTNSYNNFSVSLTFLTGSSEIIDANTKFSILMVNQQLTKIFFAKDVCSLSDDYLTISPSDYGFVAGDDILYAIKATREIPGHIYTSKLTFASDMDFIELAE